MISRGSDDESSVKNYILDNVSEECRSQIEERMFSDDAFFERIELAEADLIDSYILDKLSNNDRKLFESHFLTSSRNRKEVQMARVLLGELRKKVSNTKGSDIEGRKWWQRSIRALSPLIVSRSLRGDRG